MTDKRALYKQLLGNSLELYLLEQKKVKLLGKFNKAIILAIILDIPHDSKIAVRMPIGERNMALYEDITKVTILVDGKEFCEIPTYIYTQGLTISFHALEHWTSSM